MEQLLSVKSDAHARFDAISRTYEYVITRKKDPFLTDDAYYLRGNLDLKAMEEASRILLEETDFSSFCKTHSDVKTNLCRVSEASWREEGHKVVFTITADRFLRNMVRAIVGTLLEVGKKELNIEDFDRVIRAKDRSAGGFSVPAHGLYLTAVRYPDHIFIEPATQSLNHLIT